MKIKAKKTYKPFNQSIQYTRCRFCGKEIGLLGEWNCDCVGKINVKPWELKGGYHVGGKTM